MIGVGVIGYGYWGPNLVRNFYEADDSTVAVVCDLDQAKVDSAAKRYPTIETTTSVDALIENPAVDAVVIATPVRTHFNLAMQALKAGKHVFVEKPITETVAQAEQLIEEADKRGLLLFVDHTFVYSAPVRRIRDLVSSGDLGDVYYYDSTRVNLGLFQPDVDVIWDLAVHDISILDFVIGADALEVSATGSANIPGYGENISFLSVYLSDNRIAHINVNWLSPVKIRQTLIGGSKKMVVWDDLEPTEKIKIYDKGVTLAENETPESIYQALVGYRVGDMWVPNLPNVEPLKEEIAHFNDCVLNGTTPLSGGEAGLRVVKIAEAATKSVQTKGTPIKI